MSEKSTKTGCSTGCNMAVSRKETCLPNLVSPSEIVGGKRPCKGRLPFNVPWCRKPKGWPAGSMVYNKCGYFFNIVRAYGDPCDADSEWIEFDFKFLFNQLLTSMSCDPSCPTLESGIKHWDTTEGAVNVAKQGETWCFLVMDEDGNESYVYASMICEDDEIKDPIQKPECWTTTKTPEQIMLELLQGCERCILTTFGDIVSVDSNGNLKLDCVKLIDHCDLASSSDLDSLFDKFTQLLEESKLCNLTDLSDSVSTATKVAVCSDGKEGLATIQSLFERACFNLPTLDPNVCSLTKVAFGVDTEGCGRLYKYNDSSSCFPTINPTGITGSRPPSVLIPADGDKALSDVEYYNVNTVTNQANIDPVVGGSTIDRALLEKTLVAASLAPVELKCATRLRFGMVFNGVVFDNLAENARTDMILTVSTDGGPETVMLNSGGSAFPIVKITNAMSGYNTEDEFTLTEGSHVFKAYMVSATAGNDMAAIKAGATNLEITVCRAD